MNERLARRYRRRLWAYPAGPRRDELLDTLLECAGPDRRRPTAGETVNLIRHGLRARLGRPGSTAVVVFAVLVALVSGFVGAAAANRLAWAAMPPLPTGAAAERLAATAFPRLPVLGGGDAPAFVATGDGESIRYGYADYWVRHTPQTRDVAAYSAGVRDRLAAAGWRIGAEPAPGPDTETDGTRHRAFWATRDGLLLEYSASYWPGRPWYDPDGFTGFQLSQRENPVTLGAALAGGLLGAFAGWLLTGWVSRRTERRPGTGSLAGTATAAALLLVLPALLLSLGAVSGEPAVTPFWAGLAGIAAPPAYLSGFIALLVLGGAGAAPLWRRLWALRRRPSAAVAVVAVAAVLAGVGWYRSAGVAWAGGSCTPSVPPAVEADPLSRVARVYVGVRSTPEELNLIQAGIFGVLSTGLTFQRDSLSAEFREVYCGGARLPQAVGRMLPWYFTVWLSSPGVLPALEAEMRGRPGVVAVQRVPD